MTMSVLASECVLRGGRTLNNAPRTLNMTMAKQEMTMLLDIRAYD